MEIIKDLDVENYIYDCCLWSDYGLWSDGSFKEHFELVDEVLG